MAFKTIRDYLPELYYPILPEFFLKEIPTEIFTDCANCHMICNSREEFGLDESKPFAPDTKCCTYMPYIPNYLAGAILSEHDASMAEGRKGLRKYIHSKKGVFPHGIYPTKKYSLLYEYGRSEGFGKSRALKCPFFLDEKLNCSLWKYREAVCATWFCKYVGQQSGHQFWTAVTQSMKYIEDCLTMYILTEEKLPLIHPFGKDKNISYEDLDDLPLKKNEYNFRWEKWEGKEEEFYIRSYQYYFNNLTSETFSDLMGVNFRLLLNELNEKYKIMLEIPAYLKADMNRVVKLSNDKNYRVEMKTYIERNDSYITHAVEIPTFIIDAFNGEFITPEVLQNLEKKHGITVEKDILIALYQHGILLKIN